MKLFKLFIIVLLFNLSGTFLSSCEGEKDLVIIENVPIKLPALYMVGDATPAGWDIGNSVAMTQNPDDTMLFEYEGDLYAGEMKCPTEASGNWGCNYIMPPVNGVKISKTGIEDSSVVMIPGGNPDNKWVITDEGRYHISINLRDMTMTVNFLD